MGLKASDLANHLVTENAERKKSLKIKPTSDSRIGRRRTIGEGCQKRLTKKGLRMELCVV